MTKNANKALQSSQWICTFHTKLCNDIYLKWICTDTLSKMYHTTVCYLQVCIHIVYFIIYLLLNVTSTLA